jgi:DNA mismatch repair protein MutS
MGIAWAVVEYLAKNKTKRALTLFATHYHELTNLSKKYDQIKNYQMAIKKEEQGIVFLYQVISGSAWHSYGIEVAKLAGLPRSVIRQANYILQKTKKEQKELYRGKRIEDKEKQIDLFENNK